MNPTIIILIVVVVLLVVLVGMYNSLISLRNQAEEALSDIDVQLKRRYDLVPNLIESVKGTPSRNQGCWRP